MLSKFDINLINLSKLGYLSNILISYIFFRLYLADLKSNFSDYSANLKNF